MNLKQFYEKMENPFENKEFLTKIIKEKVKGRSTYSILTQPEKQNKQGISESDYVDFANKSFEIWKQNILNLKNPNYKNVISNNFDELVKFVNSFKEFKSVDDIYDVRVKIENELVNSKYHPYWQHESNNWIYYTNEQATATNDKDFSDQTCRVYVNIDNVHMYKFAQKVMEKCLQKNLAYSFKMQEFGTNRDDAIVFYPDTRTLGKILNVIKEIQTENPEMFDEKFKAPASTASVLKSVGFADEPKVAKFYDTKGNIVRKNVSFNQKMESVIDNSFSKIILNQSLRKVEKDLSHKQMITQMLKKELYQRMSFESLSLNPRIAYGKTAQEIKQIENQLKNTISNYVDNNYKQILKAFTEYLSTKKVAPSAIVEINRRDRNVLEVNLAKGVKAKLSPSKVRGIALEIARNVDIKYDKFAEVLFKDIQQNAKQYGIDANKFILFEKQDGLLNALGKTTKQTNTTQHTQ